MHACTFLQTTTATTVGLAGGVMGNGGDILDAADLEAVTGEGTEGLLGAGSRGAGLDTTGSAKLNVDGGDTDLLKTNDNVLGGHHGGVRRRLVTIGLHLHTTGDTGDGLTTGAIGDVNEGIVEGGVHVRDSEDIVAGRVVDRHLALNRSIVGDFGSSLLRSHLCRNLL